MAKRSKKKKKTTEVKASRVAVAEPKKLPPIKEIPLRKFPGQNWRIIVQALVIAASVLWIYWPALHGSWLWDDTFYITDNPLMQDPERLWKAWFEPGSFVEYYPIQETVQWLQWRLWGMNTLGYHLTNIFLHILSAFLVWRLLSKFGLRLAWLGGLIFAIHPVQIESVAWIVELKNTLSLPPFLLAMCAWIDYEERGKAKDYWLAVGLFLIAMLCKITMATFPVVILLYVWWKRGRIGWSDIKTSLPFWLISLVLGFTAIWTGQDYLLRNHSEPAPVALGGFFSRLACAGLSLSCYFSQCFLPLILMPIYPQWTVEPPALWQFLPFLAFCRVIYWLWAKRKGWGRHALLGLGFFLILLSPFLGFKTISYMSFTWVMDHFLYLPIIGLIGLAVASLGQLEMQLPTAFRPYGIGLATIVLALLAFASRGYAALYINPETFWTYELRCNPDAYTAYNNLGIALRQMGRVDEAIVDCQKALAINPNFADAHANLGDALLQKEQVDAAIVEYQRALEISPNYDVAHNNLGLALAQKGQVDLAIDQYEKVLANAPYNAKTQNNLGYALSQKGQTREAIGQYEKALEINPNYAEAHYNLGVALTQKEQLNDAIVQFQEALNLNPNYAEAHNKVGIAFFQKGQVDEAIAHFQKALEINPNDADAHNSLGIALFKKGETDKAIAQFKEALLLDPSNISMQHNLAKVEAMAPRKAILK